MSSAFWRFNQKKITRELTYPKLKTNLKPDISQFTVNNDVFMKPEITNIKTSYPIEHLRLKSDLDLKYLWYVLLKEKIATKSEINLHRQKELYVPEDLEKSHNSVKCSMNRIKEVIDERIKHKNNMMTFLEFYNYKCFQYKRNFKYKYEDLSSISEPMFSNSEMKKLDYLEEYLDDYKNIKRIDSIYSEKEDLNDVFKIVPYNFDPLDPLNLKSCFENRDTYKYLNKALIAKENFIFKIKLLKDFHKDSEISDYFLLSEKIKQERENLNIIPKGLQNILKDIEEVRKRKIEKNNKYVNFLFKDANKKKEISEAKIRTIINRRNKANHDINAKYDKKIKEKVESYKAPIQEKLNVLLDKAKKLDFVKSFTSNAVVYFKKDKTIIRIEREPDLINKENQISEYIKYASQLLFDSSWKNSLVEYEKRVTKYLDKVKENIQVTFDEKLANIDKDHLEKNFESFALNKNYVSELLNYQYQLSDCLKEGKNKNMKEILDNSETFNFEINENLDYNDSLFIDSNIAKLISLEVNSLIQSEADKNNINQIKENQKSGVSVLSSEELKAVEILKSSTKVNDMLNSYVKNVYKFNPKQRKELIENIQRGKSQLSQKIFKKELAAIAYQANKVKNELIKDNTKKKDIVIEKINQKDNIDLLSIVKKRIKLDKQYKSKNITHQQSKQMKYDQLSYISLSNTNKKLFESNRIAKLDHFLKNNADMILREREKLNKEKNKASKV